MIKTNKFFLALLALSALALGCNSKTSADSGTTLTHTETSALPGGWTQAKASGENLSIGVPPGWKAVDMSTQEFEQSIAADKKNPALAESMTMAEQMAKNKEIKLFVFHDKVGSFTPNLNISETPGQPGLTLDQVVQASRSSLPSIAKMGDPQHLQIDGVDAVQIPVTLPMNTTAGQVTLTDQVYVLMKNGKQYALTFSLPQGSGLEKDVQQMAQSFKAE